MKATKIYYKKLSSLGNYENEEIGIEIQVEESEKASDVLKKAKQFVEGFSGKDEKEEEYNRALRVLKQKDNYPYKTVMDAQEIVEEYEKEDKGPEDLPF